MQKNLVIGNVVEDPVLNTQKDQPYTKLRIAVNDSNSKDALFMSVYFSGKVAELICQYLTKGRLVAVEFTMKNSKYIKDSVEVHTFDFYGTNCTFLDRKEKGNE